MQTELLTKILSVAEAYQKEHDLPELNVVCVYVAMLDFCSGKSDICQPDCNEEEYSDLCELIQNGPCSDRNQLVGLMSATINHPKHLFSVWLSTGNRTAVDAYKFIEPKISRLIEDEPHKSNDNLEHIADDTAVMTVTRLNDSGDDIEPAEEDEPFSIEALVKKTVELREKLLKKILGQNYAITKLTDGYFAGELNAIIDKDRKGPRSVFLFAGSPGVGKSFLAKSAAEALGIAVKQFDMSSYSDDDAAMMLTGADANYKHPRPGDLTGYVYKNPKCVLIFDEIEKAHPKVINLFLQVLDAGVLFDDKYEKNISFTDTIVIFTTNAGKQLYKDSEKRNFSDLSKKVILDALEKDINPANNEPYFPQAICSRLASGNVFMFNHLSANDLTGIAEKLLKEQQTSFSENLGIECCNSEQMATTVLFSLGGLCDARNLTGAVKKFFAAEVFELLRLKSADVAIKKINWELDLSDASEHIRELYEMPDDISFMFFGNERDRAVFENWNGYGKCYYAGTIDEAISILSNNELGFVAVDYLHEVNGQMRYLNAEDVNSKGKELFEKIKAEYPHIPVYIWETEKYAYSREETVSFLRRSAYDVIRLLPGESEKNTEMINRIQAQLWQQKSLDLLTTKHKVITYETSQTISEDGTEGFIRVFGLKISTAVDADEQNAVLSAEEKPNKHWEDVVVSDDAKAELQYFQEYLKDPKSFLKKGAKAPKGILLYGPPGTGKTSLAKVMATESDVTFLSASADQFLSKWVGEGPRQMHNIFSTARKYAPAILFIDEIDAIGRRRTDNDTGGRQEILNALLTEMDGFKSTPNKPVLVMAATNLGGNNGNTGALDSALVRRFDRSINIDLPDREGRKQLITIMCMQNKIIQISEEMLSSLADRTIGMSPALIEGALNAAVRDAIRTGSVADDAIVNDAFEKFNNGEEKQWDKSELLKTARHEAGHALVCRYYGGEPSYLTIVARDNHGGYMLNSNDENKGSFTKKELLQKISTSLGGRAAELVYYGNEDGMTTGPSGDLETATRIARAMICHYGMYEDVAMSSISDERLTGELEIEVNKAVNNIISSELEKTKTIIKNNMTAMDRLVDELMKKTHLNKDEILDILM